MCLFRMHYVIWAIFKIAALKKMTNTKYIMTSKYNYVPVIAAFYTYNFLAGYGE